MALAICTADFPLFWGITAQPLRNGVRRGGTIRA
jgi:hypothetical protein